MLFFRHSPCAAADSPPCRFAGLLSAEQLYRIDLVLYLSAARADLSSFCRSAAPLSVAAHVLPNLRLPHFFAVIGCALGSRRAFIAVLGRCAEIGGASFAVIRCHRRTARVLLLRRARCVTFFDTGICASCIRHLVGIRDLAFLHYVALCLSREKLVVLSALRHERAVVAFSTTIIFEAMVALDSLWDTNIVVLPRLSFSN